LNAPPLAAGCSAAAVQAAIALALALEHPLETLHVVRAALAAATTFPFAVLHFFGKKRSLAWLLVDACAGALQEVVHGPVLVSLEPLAFLCKRCVGGACDE